jgi:hypothetical protein
MNTFNGIPVHINDLMCRGQINRIGRIAPQGIGPGKVYISDETRAMMDRWAREFFGAEPDKCYCVDQPGLVQGKMLIMSSALWEKTQAAMKEAQQHEAHEAEKRLQVARDHLNPKAWAASAAAIIAAQNAERPFSYYDQTLPEWQRRKGATR